MKATINNIDIEGTPQEIAEFVKEFGVATDELPDLYVYDEGIYSTGWKIESDGPPTFKDKPYSIYYISSDTYPQTINTDKAEITIYENGLVKVKESD